MTVLSDAPTRASRPAPHVSDRRRPLLIAPAIVIGLGGLLLYFACRSDMWLDEALSVNIARLPLSDLRQALKHDGAPPLYYVLLHVWTGVFGTGDLAARSLSGVCMAGAVVVTWFAARRFGSTRIAWLAAIVMLANPFAIRYSTEARMYALEILLVAAGILAFQRMLDSPTVGRAAVFGVLVALFGCLRGIRCGSSAGRTDPGSAACGITSARMRRRQVQRHGHELTVRRRGECARRVTWAKLLH